MAKCYRSWSRPRQRIYRTILYKCLRNALFVSLVGAYGAILLLLPALLAATLTGHRYHVSPIAAAAPYLLNASSIAIWYFGLRYSADPENRTSHRPLVRGLAEANPIRRTRVLLDIYWQDSSYLAVFPILLSVFVSTFQTPFAGEGDQEGGSTSVVLRRNSGSLRDNR